MHMPNLFNVIINYAVTQNVSMREYVCRQRATSILLKLEPFQWLACGKCYLTNKQTKNTDLLENDSGTKNCIYKD